MEIREFMIAFDEMCRAQTDCRKCPLTQRLIALRGDYMATIDRRYMGCAAITMKYARMSEQVLTEWLAARGAETNGKGTD